MSGKRTIVTFLVLTLLLAIVAIGITLIRGGADLRPIDPKLTVGLTVMTLVNVINTFGMIVGLNVFIGFLVKTPVSILIWIPLGTIFVVLAHKMFGSSFDLIALERIGGRDAFLMYFPAVGLATLAGGFLGSFFQRK